MVAVAVYPGDFYLIKRCLFLQRQNPLDNIPIHERLRTGILLALVGGFLDAYTYILRGGVFANAQTGNLVLLGVSAANGEWQKAVYYIIPVFAFFAGVLVTETIKKHYADTGMVRWEHIVLMIEIVLLLVIGFLPLTVPDAIVNVTISFVCSMQVNSFRKMKGNPYATTMCTGNLRSAAEQFFLLVSRKDRSAGKKCGSYFIIILSFCIGAALGAVLCGLFFEKAVWLCCILLLSVLLIMLYGK